MVYSLYLIHEWPWSFKTKKLCLDIDSESAVTPDFCSIFVSTVWHCKDSKLILLTLIMQRISTCTKGIHLWKSFYSQPLILVATIKYWQQTKKVWMKSNTYVYITYPWICRSWIVVFPGCVRLADKKWDRKWIWQNVKHYNIACYRIHHKKTRNGIYLNNVKILKP